MGLQILGSPVRFRLRPQSRLAQLVERKTLNLVVVGSSPTVGVVLLEPMAQRQRVGFQTRRLGVRIPLGSLLFVRVYFFSNPSTIFQHRPRHTVIPR